MKILLFSDSHGASQNIIKVIKKNKNVDAVIHLGDFTRDMLSVMEQFKNIEYEIVSGNNDWSREFPSEKILVYEGKKIFITHGHHYNVKNEYQRIINKGKAVNAEAVFFGHTHTPEEMFSDGMLILNPGSIGNPSSAKRTYCSIEIREGRFWPGFEYIDY